MEWEGSPLRGRRHNGRQCTHFHVGGYGHRHHMYLCCCGHARKIKIVLFAQFNLSLFGKRLGANVNRRTQVFVLYNHGEQDRCFVHDQLLPLLDRHGITHITEDCFLPGRDVFSCLEICLKQSRSALVIISPDFLRENWNLYHLNQAVCTEIYQTNFKLMFLLRQNLKSSGPFPENLSLFLRINTTIKGYKKDWENQLIYELKHRTKKSVNQGLTFGNDSDENIVNPTVASHHPPVSSEVSIQVGSSMEISVED